MGDKIELVSYTQLNPAIAFCDIKDLPSDISLLRSGIGTEQENLIEYAGRVCYLSTSKMGTSPNFIVARVREGHEDIIEHIVVTLRVPKQYMPYLFRNFNRHFEVTTEGQEEEFTGNWIVSGNVRVWLDIFRQGMLWEAIPILKAIAPSVFAEFDKFRVFELDYYARYYCDDLIPMSNPPQTVSLLAFSQPQFGNKETRLHHGSATFLFEGISRACTHQLVRHRLASFSQESQRYVDLKKGEWEPIIPQSIKNDEKNLFIMEQAWEMLQSSYQKLRKNKVRKEDARFLLPNAAETRIVTTMNFESWSHFFWLRAVDKAAQWEIRSIGQMALEQLYTIAPGVFQEHWDVYQEKFKSDG